MTSDPEAHEAQTEPAAEQTSLPPADPGIDRSIAEAIGWLCRAQDASASADGGVAGWYDIRSGWSTSYPETTGYIVPTLLDCADRQGDEQLRTRARKMLDWLVSIQFEAGGFQGGIIGREPRVPVTFNTGQVLLGLAAGVRAFGDAYLSPTKKAADWLVETQGDDGSWTSHPSPFTLPGAKTYEIQVAWGLLEAARVTGERRYASSALASVDWALDRQRANGWLEGCDLSAHEKPLTHTLAYALRGIVEAHRHTPARRYRTAARRTADALLQIMDPAGFIPGRLDRAWRSVAHWACLTGTAQIAACWLLLAGIQAGTERAARYRQAAYRANQFVRRTIRLEAPAGIRGGVAGSFPIDGDYMRNSYPNWACKFFVDANLLELDSGRSNA